VTCHTMRAARAMAFVRRRPKSITHGGISSSVRQFQYLDFSKGRSSTMNVVPSTTRWSSTGTPENKKASSGGGLWTRLAKWLEGPDEIRVERAKKILDSIEEQARLDFSNACGLDQGKFRHQFALEMLHLWILKLNLVAADKTEGAKLFAEICEQVWARTEPRLYKEGVLSLMLSKNLKEVQQWTFGSMTAYDKAVVALQNDDSDAELIGALWRNVFDCDKDAKPEHVATLADYALDQIEGLQQTDVDKMFTGQVGWLPPPTTLSRTQEDLDLNQYGTPVVIPGKESKVIEFRWSSQYPIVR